MYDDNGHAPVLDFAIIGAQKSASTFLHEVLAEHPQVDMPREESRHFEDPYYGRGAADTLASVFGPRDPHVRRGIKRPDYLAQPPVARRLAGAFPDLRLLAVLRDPVPRAISAYFDYVRLGFLPLQDVEDAFRDLLDGSLTRRFPRAVEILDYGLYGKHLARYLDLFPRSQLHILFQDDLATAPLPHIAEVCRFLQVDDSWHPERSDRRRNTTVYASSRLRLLRSRNALGFSYASDRSRREPRSRSAFGLAWVATATLIDRILLAPFDRRDPPRLEPETEARLRSYYADDVVELARLLGRSLPWSQQPG